MQEIKVNYRITILCAIWKDYLTIRTILNYIPGAVKDYYTKIR